MKCHDREDPVDALVTDLTAQEVVDWLVKYKKLPADEAENVESNLREQFKWHRLQGRLDRHPFLATLAELWLLRQSVKKLVRPKKVESTTDTCRNCGTPHPTGRPQCLECGITLTL